MTFMCLVQHGAVPPAVRERLEAGLGRLPASWLMEGGRIMPEPGEEADWLAARR